MATKHAGLALMAGIVLVFVSSLFLPGNALINPVDQTDFPVALEALGDSPILAQWMTFATLISMLLMSFGLLALYPLANRQTGLGGRLLQFGIVTSVIEWSILIIAAGMRHFVIHLMQRSELPIEGSQSAADFQAAALLVHTDMTAVLLAFVVLFPLAAMMVGIGLSKRFVSMDAFKASSYVLAATGFVGLINFLVVINSPDLGLPLMLWINSAVLYIGAISLFIIGFGMYKGRSELSDEGSSA